MGRPLLASGATGCRARREKSIVTQGQRVWDQGGQHKPQFNWNATNAPGNLFLWALHHLSAEPCRP